MINEKAKVSIIMGAYNSENCIDIAIQSIIEQAYTNWELIICDDASTDNTYELLLKWKKIDSRICPIRNAKNLGLARTLNHCLKYSTGEFIARMDDDDWSYPERIQKQVDFLNNNKEYAFVSSAVDIFDGQTITHKQNVRAIKPVKEDFLWNSPFVHPATMFRKESLVRVKGYRYAKETRRAEDIDLFMRMYAKGMKGYNISESLLRYYVNPYAMKKRKYKYRIDEAIVRYKGYKMLGLMPKGLLYVIKPLVVGLIPKGMILNLQKRIYR